MPVKHAIAKTWSIVPSSDGKRWSGWPAGDKPGALLRWDASSGAADYTVKWGTSTGSYGSSQAVGNVTTYNPSSLGLSTDVTYYMAVFANNANGQSTASNEIQVRNGAQVGP